MKRAERAHRRLCGQPESWVVRVSGERGACLYGPVDHRPTADAFARLVVGRARPGVTVEVLGVYPLDESRLPDDGWWDRHTRTTFTPDTPPGTPTERTDP